jgi:hypothetical protein
MGYENGLLHVSSSVIGAIASRLHEVAYVGLAPSREHRFPVPVHYGDQKVATRAIPSRSQHERGDGGCEVEAQLP